MQESPAAALSAREFVERELRAAPDLSYGEVRDRAARQGLNVQRFLYGSTRRSLGLPTRLETDASAAVAPNRRDAVADAPPPADAAIPVVTAAEAAGERGDEERSQPLPTDQAEGDAPPARNPAPRVSAFDFAVSMLRMSPEISFQDLKARADLEGMTLPPIVYGRAKAYLGLVPTKPRRSRTDPPRLLRQVDSATQVNRLPALDGIRSVEQLVETVRQLEAERQRLRAALAAILDAVDGALQSD